MENGVVSGTAPREAHGDFPCIDGLRALPAITVVLCHTVGVSGLVATTPGAYLAGLRAGVQVFFVISGFVLYRPFALAHFSQSRGPSMAGYFRRRFLRIFPAYWVVLTVGVYVLGVIYLFGEKAIVTNYLLVQSYTTQTAYSGLGPAWTLVIEVSFYVFLPFYALAIWRLGRRRPCSTELVGCGVLFVVALSCSALVAYGSPPMAISVLPAHFAPFALGMALAVTRTAVRPGTKAWSWSEQVAGAAWKPWLLAGLAFSATVWAVHYPAVLGVPGPTGSTQMSYSLLIGAMGLFVVLPAVFGDQSRGVGRRVLRAGPIVFLGLISYGIYLWHVPVITELRQNGMFVTPGHGRTWTDFIEVSSITLVVTVVIATVSWYVLEKPLIQLSRRRRLLPASVTSSWRAPGRSTEADSGEDPPAVVATTID